MNKNRFAAAAWILLTVSLISCHTPDPLEDILAERAKWEVVLLSFAELEDGSIQAQCSLTGPVYSNLETITVRFDLLGPDDNLVLRTWRSFDLRDVERGTTRVSSIRFLPTEDEVVQIAMDQVLRPSSEDLPYLKELSAFIP